MITVDTLWECKILMGVLIENYTDLEKCFKLSICVYEMHSDKSACMVYRPLFFYCKIIYLNMFKNHLMFMKDKTFVKNIFLRWLSYNV